ncbi:MAG: lipoprotein insertase outer membrane protein LolB [Legionellaceae bacterium]|nr:lipoprotein insertase outer membrane protein LolB [Legionellaceae bacterium]
MLFKKHILNLSLILLFSACTTATNAPSLSTSDTTKADKQSVAKRVQAAKHLSSWTITGALAAKSKRKTWTASMNWKQQGLNRYRLHLFGPLGGGSVLVEKNGRLVTYQDGPKRVTTTNISQLFYKETGIRVPLHNLYYWVRGVQAPGATQSEEYDATGHLKVLKQGGYTIRYDSYQTVKNFDLPTKIRIAGPGGQLKLIIKDWKIH